MTTPMRVRVSARRRIERAGLIGIPAAAAGFVALLAIARWPRYWEWIAPERTPMTWLGSMLLMLCTAAALLLAAATGMHGPGAPQAGAVGGVDGRQGRAWRAGRHGRPRGKALRWVALAAGFAYLALDERFALHERLRDGYLAPRGVSVPFLSWVAPGDFLLLGYGVVGLALLPVVLRLFSGDPQSRRLLFAGAALAVLAVLGDSFDVHTMSLAMEVREQTAEEVVELGSSVCFLLALWLRVVSVLAAVSGPRWADAVPLDVEPDTEPAPASPN